MKKLSVIIASLVLVLGVSKAVVASDTKTATHAIGINIDQFALLDIESTVAGNAISLNPTAPTEAGLGVDFSNATNSDLWLNYSSIVSATKLRSVSATISGTLPGGTSISVQAAAPQNGNGLLGSANASAQTLTENGITVISGIGSCYTGNGHQNGSNLTYKLNMNAGSYQTLVDGVYNVTVTYTISDEL